ncbi:S-methyl thiohydantoin desulfurase domain-containing protein [Streptomyces sp. NPDC002851]
MRELNADDARRGVLGGGVFACGGGGWRHHGELMGQLATSVGRPVLARVDELPADTWVATVTAIGAPAAQNWEIRPVDYVHALQKLIEVCPHPIAAVMTAQNGYSTTHNGWIQSAVLGIPVLDASGDVRAHPTGKLGSLGLTGRPGYVSTQVVSGGNRELHGHFLSVNQGSVQTCDDVLRDISVRTGGFIASARNPVELSWVKEHAALGAISLALDLGHAMESAADKASNGARGEAVVRAVCDTIGAEELARGPLHHEVELVTKGGWDHGTFRIGDCTVPYLNEYMAVERGGERVASYPDTIAILRAEDGFPVAVEDAHEGQEVVLLVADSTALPLSSSAVDPVAVGECEQIMGLDFLRHLPAARTAAA